MATRIATSALTGRIFEGKVDSKGLHFVGQKKDVTGDVLKAVIDEAEYHGVLLILKVGIKSGLLQ